MKRYSCIQDKDPREIVLLRGLGCYWKKCTFCDYYRDASSNAESNYLLNKDVLSKVTGKYKNLEIINSGSFIELDDDTLSLIDSICVNGKIERLHIELHWMFRAAISNLRNHFSRLNVELNVKIGVETFDEIYRESVLKKGMPGVTPVHLSDYADEVNLLVGLKGQTEGSMLNDIQTGMQFFKRVCVNVMSKNTAPMQPDPKVVKIFMEKIYPLIEKEKRVDILLSNTDFGVGE